jgi:DNA-binding XRE family transcriptional regulator
VIRLRLKEVLEEHGVSPYALGKAVEGISPKTVYMYVNGMRQPSLGALSNVIKAIRELTGENIEVEDVLKYEHDAN